MARERTSVARALIVFTLSSLLVLIVVAAAGVTVLRRIATTQAEEDAARVAVVAVRGIVEPRLLDGIAQSDLEAALKVDQLVFGGLLREPIAAFQIVDSDGVVRYADRTELTGTSVALNPAEIDALPDGGVASSGALAPAVTTLVPPPNGTTATRSLPQASRTAFTSAADPGRTTASGALAPSPARRRIRSG